MQLLTLTLYASNNRKVHVNAGYIESFLLSADSSHTKLYMIGDIHNLHLVQETPEDIILALCSLGVL